MAFARMWSAHRESLMTMLQEWVSFSSPKLLFSSRFLLFYFVSQFFSLNLCLLFLQVSRTSNISVSLFPRTTLYMKHNSTLFTKSPRIEHLGRQILPPYISIFTASISKIKEHSNNGKSLPVSSHQTPPHCRPPTNPIRPPQRLPLTPRPPPSRPSPNPATRLDFLFQRQQQQ